MAGEHRKLLRMFTFRRIIIPVIIGLLAAVFFIYRDISKERYIKTTEGQGEYVWNDLNNDGDIEKAEFEFVGPGEGDYIRMSRDDFIKRVKKFWSDESYHWLLVALMLIAIRDVSYMYRIRLLTGNRLSWLQSFQVIMLWEFASSVTPSIVGGSAIALFILRKEGINMGKTTAIVMITAVLDELFYIVMVPVAILIAGIGQVFPEGGNFLIFSSKFGSRGIFFIGYIFIIVLNAILIYGIFINPKRFKWLLIRIFHLPFLRKWLLKAAETGDEIIVTSHEMKGKSFLFWAKAYGATVFSWTARFAVVNILILTLTGVDDHFLIYARQLVMWVILLISPTPGSSGAAEYFFPVFFGEYIPGGLSSSLALLWRMVTYYPYLLVGMILLPAWIRRVYFKRRRRIKFSSKR